MKKKNIKCQIPYNFEYGSKILEIIYDNRESIDSIYFGFENACRDLGRNRNTVEEHMDKLIKIKKETGIKLAYVLNTIVKTNINDCDRYVLDSGQIDIVIIALDDMYRQIYEIYGEQFEYEVSRFYYLLDENINRQLESRANCFAFGFEKELEQYVGFSNAKKIIYIVNENCYKDCDMKLIHNMNQLKRNAGENIPKFNCPYLDKRRFYSYEDIDHVCDSYPISILKVCDRAFSDDVLEEEFGKWLNYVKKN